MSDGKTPGRLNPDFWTARKRDRRRLGYMLLVGFVFSGTALCTRAVAFERKRNNFKDRSDATRSDHTRSGCFNTA